MKIEASQPLRTQTLADAKIQARQSIQDTQATAKEEGSSSEQSLRVDESKKNTLAEA